MSAPCDLETCPICDEHVPLAASGAKHRRTHETKPSKPPSLVGYPPCTSKPTCLEKGIKPPCWFCLRRKKGAK